MKIKTENSAQAEPQAKAAHTPGPWRVAGQHNPDVFKNNYRLIEAGDGYFTGSINEDVLFQERNGFCLSGYLNDADARLIAAAPELLAALKRFRYVVLDSRAWEEGAFGDDMPEAFKAVDAAIAKAEGARMKTFIFHKHEMFVLIEARIEAMNPADAIRSLLVLYGKGAWNIVDVLP